MRALLQRVTQASVTVDGQIVGAIGRGLCVLVGVTHTDDATNAVELADKISHLRLFDDQDGVMNRSVLDVDGEVLVVSQFTLYGDTRKGRRPSWAAAAGRQQAEPLIEAVILRLREQGAVVATGRFGADMAVMSVNDGPVTVSVEI